MQKNSVKSKIISPVVGIGASAGGLEQFSAFFDNMSDTCGATFILVQHLDPNHGSMLPELLSKHTAMPVHCAEDGMELLSDHVYVLPPKKQLILDGTRLSLSPIEKEKGANRTIDRMFNSIAVEAGPLSVGVLLSGSGFDGTDGIKSIKENGGIVIVQDPDAAEYDSMPKSAIRTGIVDYICKTEEMPELLKNLLPNIQNDNSLTLSLNSGNAEQDIKAITNILFERTGNDFSKYKDSTVLRRINRRIVMNKLQTTDEYLKLLKENKTEVDKLFIELLIGVTSFFRDSTAFSVLEEKVLKELINKHKKDGSLRVWVPGCSTGEEAYTIAIMLKELLRNRSFEGEIQLFATDINEQAITKAREGLFGGSIKNNLPQHIFSNYFHWQPETGQYQINSDIRDMIVFAVQNVLADPPFSQMNLISCRNLLIYLDQSQQDRLFQIFHYALKDDGTLFLGESETVGKKNSYFTAIDRKHKIYKKLFPVSRSKLILRMASSDYLGHRKTNLVTSSGKQSAPGIGYQEVVESFILGRLSPCTILLNEKNEILYIHGKSGLYLEPAEGNMNISIIKMARNGLSIPISNLLRKVKVAGEPINENAIVYKNDDGETLTVDISVMPLESVSDAEERFILIFRLNDRKPSAGNSADPEKKGDDKTRLIIELESELNSMREYLQTTIEEKESSNEELQSTNEELQSSNEELQSTNEELETSKEELQSINEELSTVNAELEHKVELLTEANNDIDNLLKSTAVASIFLDKGLRIKRFTPSVVSIIDLISGDIGRPLERIVTNLDYADLNSDTEKVQRTLENIEKEVKTKDGRFLLMRIMPYRTLDNYVDGLVLTFTDVTMLRTTEQKVLELAKFPDENPFPVMRIAREGKILYANPSSRDVLQELNTREGDFMPDKWITNLQRILDENRQSQFDLPVRDRHYILAAAPVVEGGYVNIYAMDITERKDAEEELLRQKNHLKLALDSAHAGAWFMKLKTLEYTIDENFCGILGYAEKSMKFISDGERVHPEDRDRFKKLLQDIIDGKSNSFSVEHRIKRADGEWVWIHAWAKRENRKGRDEDSLYGVVIDISEQKKLEHNLQCSIDEKSLLLRELSHRTKNNLFVIRSMINLQAAHTENDEFQEIVKDIDGKIFSMALVHQKLYKSRNFSQIELKGFFSEFLEVLFQSYRNPDKDIALNYEAQKVTVHIDRAIPCGIVVAEIISNAFKHAFEGRDRGRIDFKLDQSPDGVVLLAISDDGRGVPPDFDFRSQKSLGLKTVFMIVEQQIQGELEFRNSGGLTFEIRFSDVRTDGEL